MTKHLTDVKKNSLQTWIPNAWKLLGFSGCSLQWQYKGPFLRASLTYTRLMERHNKTQEILETQLETHLAVVAV